MVTQTRNIEQYGPWVDRLGAWTSVLCVLHCLLTPILLSFSAVLAHLLPGDETVHRVLAMLVACFGAFALVNGYRRHRQRSVMVLLLSGLGCIFAAAWFGDYLPSHLWEVGITFMGSALMVTAHRLNHSFCKACSIARAQPCREARCETSDC